MMIDTTRDTIRIHAFEFGTLQDAHDAEPSARFGDIRVSSGFPASAVRTARLAALSVRCSDLWRLVDPAARDGALLVWPACPAQPRVHLTADEEDAIDSPAMRVISLIRTDYPAARARRWRAWLNARSIVVAETDWQRLAADLLRCAPALLRDHFDEIFQTADAEASIRLAHASAAAVSSVAAGSLAARLHESMACGRALELGPDAVADESEFWTCAADALSSLPPPLRARVSLASGFASPFAQDAVRFVPGAAHPAVRSDIRIDRKRGPAQSLACAAFGRLLDAAIPVEDAAGVADLQHIVCDPDGALEPLAHEIAVQLGNHAAAIARELHVMAHKLQQVGALDLDRIEGCAQVAFALPADGRFAAWRDDILRQCEDRLLRGIVRAGFLDAADLRRLQTSRALSRLLQRAIETRPHAIVAPLQVSLTLLAHGDGEDAGLLDACLCGFLPARWPASEWLAQLDQEWAIHRAIAALRAAGEGRPGAFAGLEARLLNRLSCATLDRRRSVRGRSSAPMSPQVAQLPARQPA